MKEPILNAEPAVQRRLLELQDLDLQLDQVAHKRKSLPEHQALAELAAEKSVVDGDLVNADTEVSDLQREQKKADSDVDQVRQRKARNRQRMDSGQISSPRDLENLQHEIVSLDRRISDLEDSELEVMERLEAAEATQAGLRTRADAFAGRQTELEATRDAALKELDEQRATVGDQRATIAAELPDDLITMYQRLRERNGGIGAAPLVGKRCMGCRMELAPSDLSRFKASPPDAVLRCEECGRILVRTAESSV
ncbi:MAG TPA: C4-type zinc ribbon domain-containing protein [Kribbella sp.]|uniref:zinc ribbon domain-containing protein n=1 Tax=Kribbella sp. TaxID=1871183 RepID=UPI002D785088|nr:C4-type zinc ribbon domain-containing protein [Kribbella sp.]HET6294229.1 C4-type zinc ribbon domain-containing protein [Kribbella sp.]